MPTTTNLNRLTINHVANQEVYDAMAAQGLINENELYLVPGDISIATDNTPGGTPNSEALITSGAAYAGFQTKAHKNNAVYFVKGTQTGSKSASWTGALTAVDALYDGLTIAYFLPIPGDTAATLTLTLSSGVDTAAEPVYYTATTRATTHYGAGSVILLTWVSNATTGYSAVGSASGRWLHADYTDGNTVPASSCATSASTADKTATHTYYTAKANSYTLVTLRYANTAQNALTLNINSTGAKPIYINGVASSATNYILPAGTYLVFYDGTNYYFRTDGKITGSITGDAATVNGHTVQSNVPGSAAFTDTTYTFSTSSTNGSISIKNNETNDETDVSVYSLPVATSGARGGVKIGYTANGKNYPVQLSNEKMYVYVPWSNENSNYVEKSEVSVPTTLPAPTWGDTVTVGTVDNQEFKFKMPANPNSNTTYTLSQDANDGHIVKLTPSSGSVQTITIPDNNYYHSTGSWSGLTYTANNDNANNVEFKFTLPTGTSSTTVSRGDHTHSASLAADTGTSGVVNLAHGGKYKLTAGGSSVIFTLPTDNDTYIGEAAFADDTTSNANSPVKMTLTTDGTNNNQTVTANIPKVSSSSAGVAPKGAAVSTQNQNTKFLREDGTWAKPSYTTNSNTTYTLTQGSTDGHIITLTPSSGSANSVTVPDNDTYFTTGTWSGLTYTADATNANGNELKFTIPTGTSATTVAVGNHTHDYSATYAAKSHDHSQIVTVGDQRSTATTPNSYANKIIFQGLKNKSTIGSPSNDTYSYLVGLRGWSDDSGGNAHELAFNNTGLYWRQGSTTSWNAWNMIYTSKNVILSTSAASSASSYPAGSIWIQYTA